MLCQAKGQDEVSCCNYVRMVLAFPEPGGDKVLACSTHAFLPCCSWREAERIGRVLSWMDGTARCPYHPADNVTSLLTSSGDYYVGASTDFSSNLVTIYRMSGGPETPDGGSLIRTECYNSLWLDRPAQVCKDDGGGSLVLKDTFTTFLKARLNCSLAGEYPFYYDEIQSAQYVPKEGLIYVTFATGEDSSRYAELLVCYYEYNHIAT